jgi:16S rRNA (adenine1518-N6/adenine1519-N6)-dimethyltransferase
MRPDKKLGQHFLRDASVLEEISGLADVKNSPGVLEIGPGEGALTAFLARAGRPITAVDRDPRAEIALRNRFGDNVNFVHGDALTVDLESLLPPSVDGSLPVVVGNLPYNVGTAIYRRLLRLYGKTSRMVLMLQREVAHRISASHGSKTYGVLSVLTSLTARAMLVRDVPPDAFFPPPKVHSSLLYVDFPKEPLLAVDEHEAFARFVGRFFQMRRKKIIKVIPDTELLARFGIEPTQRPESVPALTYLALFREGVLSGSDDHPVDDKRLAASDDVNG